MHTLHTQEMERANAELRTRLKATELAKERELAEKETQNAEMRRRLKECESRVDVLLEVAEERDKLVERLDARAKLFYEVAEHRAALGRIVEVFDKIHEEKEMKTGDQKTLAEPNRENLAERAVTNGLNSTTNSTSSDTESPSII